MTFFCVTHILRVIGRQSIPYDSQLTFLPGLKVGPLLPSKLAIKVID